MFWLPMAAMAAMGAIQGAQQENAERKSRQNQALVNRYAPLFGQQVKAVDPAQNHILPNIFTGAIRGYEMGSQFDMDEALRDAAKQQMVTPSNSGNVYGLNLPPMKSVFDSGGGYGPELGDRMQMAGYSPSLGQGGRYNLGLSYGQNPYAH